MRRAAFAYQRKGGLLSPLRPPYWGNAVPPDPAKMIARERGYRARRPGIPGVALVVVMAGLCRGAALSADPPDLPLLTGPTYASPSAPLGLPPSFDSRVVYYNGFSRPGAAPEVDRIAAKVRGVPKVVADGFLGAGGRIATQAEALHLISPAFSPDRPVSFLLWWALDAPHHEDSSFGVLNLQGRGIVSAFSRGKGEWCALQKPAGVFQVYYFPGIQNVNGIYDYDLAAHLDLRPGVWHQTALVIRGASLCELYTDGKLVYSVRIAGRDFEQADGLTDLTFGSPFPMLIDEAMVLDRALSADEVAYYYTATSQMREAGY